MDDAQIQAFLTELNVNSHPQEIAPYLRTLAELPEFAQAIIPVGKGLSVAYR